MDGVEENMTMQCQIIVSGDGNSEQAKTILQGVIDFNNPWFKGLVPFCIYMPDDEDQVVGGITGRLDEERSEIHVWQLWVRESDRRKGLGKQLMELLEEFARDKKCHLILLDTFEFQALDFYQKLGYERFATVPKQVRGQDRYFLRKKV